MHDDCMTSDDEPCFERQRRRGKTPDWGLKEDVMENEYSLSFSLFPLLPSLFSPPLFSSLPAVLGLDPASPDQK